jgi:hypothetical protein
LASAPDRRRYWNDIHLLLAAAREQQVTMDWELLEDYLRLFKLEDKLPHLKSVHGSTD